MSALLLLGLLILNFGISFWNAFAAGAMWTETEIIGGWQRFITWCAVIMSACGFTWVYLTILAALAVDFHYLTLAQVEIMFKLGYLIIIFPVLGSGLGIWIHSLVVAYRERNFGNVAVGGWNTFAMTNNTWQAARHAPDYLGDVLEFFFPKNSKSSKDSGAGLLIILLVVLALAGGAITTSLIVRWADHKIAIKVVPS